MQLTKHFSTDEFKCPCCGVAKVDRDFVEKLENIRRAYRRPIKITSGYRCWDHNISVDGHPKSKHLEGIAVDIAIKFSDERYELIALALRAGLKGIGIGNNFIHLDDRQSEARFWVY